MRAMSLLRRKRRRIEGIISNTRERRTSTVRISDFCNITSAILGKVTGDRVDN